MCDCHPEIGQVCLYHQRERQHRARPMTALSPTFSMFGILIPYHHAVSAGALHEWLGDEDCGYTVRLRTQYVVPAPGVLAVSS